MEEIISLSNVSKLYKDKKAVNNVSFSIEKGTVTAILGPNGAGKTTTISMILGLKEPSEGSIKIFGQDSKSEKVRERIGAMLQEVSVLDSLTVSELINLFRSYYPNPLSLQELLGISGLEEEKNKRSEKLSGGQKRRLNFALALAGNPDLIFFDEPTVGMDITSRRLFWEKAHYLAKQGKTILFSTHYLEEADAIADRIILFNQGKVIADGTPEELKTKVVKSSVSFELKEHLSISAFYSLSNVQKVLQDQNRIILETDNTDSILFSLIQGNYPIRNIQIENGSLDKVFEILMDQQKEAI